MPRQIVHFEHPDNTESIPKPPHKSPNAMKKYLFLSFALLTSYSALAQSKEVLSGDYDNDGVITVADVTYMSEIILGHKQPVYITSPQAVDLEFKGQAFVDPTGTFPQFFKYDEGQGINVIGMRGQAWNSIYVDLNTVEEDGFTGHSDGGVFSLRQDDTQYLVASGFSEYSVDENGQPMLIFDYGSYSQWYNGNEKHLRDDYNYVVSKPTNFADGKASFEVCNLGALVRLSLSGLPANAWIGRVTLESTDGAIFGHFIKVNVTDDGPIVSVATDREDAYMEKMNLDTGDCWATADGKCEVYMMMAPVDLSGKKLNVLTEINGVPFRAEVQGQNMVSNHCYTYEAKDAAMQLDREPLRLGNNTIAEEGEYIFVPTADGIYEISCTGTRGFDSYDVDESELGGYEMKAGMPYRIYVYDESALTIAKKEFTSFVLGTTQAVTAGTVYVLKITDAGAYYFKSGNDENYMWTNMIGEYHISFVDNNCYNLEAGSYYIRFNEDDQITIAAATPLTLGVDNTVEAYSYYTINLTEQGLYRFSSDVDNNVSVWGNDCYYNGETPQNWIINPGKHAAIVKVWNAGKLTIEKVEVQEIALGTDTKVKANIDDKPVYTFYQFVVTENGFYHIQAPEEYGMEITSQGRDRDQQLESGTYYIRFYHWNWDNPEDQDITVKISKTAGEAKDIDDPYASNTVQLSTEENAVYYRFRPIESGTYHINVGDGCNFEILHRGSAPFMELFEWDDYCVRFWSESGDASMTTTTFSISMAETVEMAVGDWVDVSTDKVYRLVGVEEEKDYYFSAKDGYHMARVEWGGDLVENGKYTIWANDQWTLYFYHDTNSGTTTQALVKKVDKENAIPLTVGEEATVEISSAIYSFCLEEGGEYRIIVGEGCAYDIEGYGYYSGWLDANTTYYVTFYNQEGYSQQTTTARIVNTTVTTTLGVPCDLTEYVTKVKIVIEEEDYYHIAISEGWSYQIEGRGWEPDIVHLDPDTYYLTFWHDENASETGVITIDKMAKDVITIGTKKKITNKWYKLTVAENGVYEITLTNNNWVCEIFGRGTVRETVSLTAGTYYLKFTPTDSSTSTSVIISQAATKSISLYESFVVDDPEQYYTLDLTEDGFYKLEISEGWLCNSADHGGFWENGLYTGMSAGLYTYYFEQYDSNYPQATVTINKTDPTELSVGENTTTFGTLYGFTPAEEGFYAIKGNIHHVSEHNCETYKYDEGVVYLYLYTDSRYVFDVWDNGTVSINRGALPPADEVVEINQTTTFEVDKTYKIVIPEDGYYRLRFDDDTSYQWWTIRNAKGTYSLSDADSYEIPAGTYYFKSWWNATATIYKDEK